MYAVAVIEPGIVRVVEVPEPKPGPYDGLVKTEVSFICNATDRKIVDGHLPGTNRDWYPLLLGHESAGTVVAVGAKVQSFRPGDRVVGGLLLAPPGGAYKSGWGGHSEFILVRDHEAMVQDGVADKEHGWDEIYRIMKKVPSDIPLEAAGMLNTWREVHSGMFSDFSLQPEQEIVVFGAGPVGLSFVRFGRIRGFRRIVCVDPNPVRRDKALALGADEVFEPEHPELLYRRFDAIVDAVGKESIINTGLSMVRSGGSVCVFGVVGEPRILLEKERAPYNFNLLVHQWPSRTAEAASQDILVDWIRRGELDYRAFVTAAFPMKEIHAALEEQKKKTSTKTMLIYDERSGA